MQGSGYTSDGDLQSATDPLGWVTRLEYGANRCLSAVIDPDGLDTVQETQGQTVNPILVGLGIDEHYARNDINGRTYFLSDALGSTRALTDASGTLTQRYDYSPYGQTSQANAGTSNPYQYTGREQGASGLYYYRSRYYRPDLGRFISEDPIGLTGGINVYAYVEGDPMSYTDPYGLWAWGDELPQGVVDFSAGMGDTLSFGLTNSVRDMMGTNGAVNRCSGQYSAGEWSGIGVSLAFGGAHLGRNALNQGSKGLTRLAFDGRTWGRVRSVWSKAAGGGKPWLAANGQSLHHWLIPQRWASVNAGFNYFPITAGFNSWMNGSTALRVAVEWGLKGSVLGIYGAPATMMVNNTCGCDG